MIAIIISVQHLKVDKVYHAWIMPLKRFLMQYVCLVKILPPNHISSLGLHTLHTTIVNTLLKSKTISTQNLLDIGNPHVFYGFNNIILSPDVNYMKHPYLPMSEKLREDITKYGMFDFWIMGHHFYLEVIPILANVHLNSYLQNQANNTIIRIKNNEGIYELNDVMQIDFLMQRFNS